MPSLTTSQVEALASSSVEIHPLVLLSAVDHASRVAKGSRKRVCGILLGQDNGKVINVANSFAVPFEEDERDPKTWFIDHNYIESMNDMFKQISAKEKLIGWYHSGPKLRSSDLEINQVIKRYCQRPIMVIIDVRNRETADIPTDAYLAVEEIKDDGTAAQKTFLRIPSTVVAEEAEEIGVEHLLRDIKDLETGTLSSRVADQLASLSGLSIRLQEIQEYLGKVVAGDLPVNHQIIYNLQDVFNLLPNLEGASALTTTGSQQSGKIRKPFSVATVVTNDQLLVLYLSSLIRAVVALHDLVNNKLELQNAANKDESVPDPTSEEDKSKAKDDKDAAKPQVNGDSAKDDEKTKNDDRGL